jgi:carbonic anhydrase
MHKAKRCAITCIDFRFQEKIHRYMEENGYLGNTDIISIAGCSRDIVAPIDPSQESNMLRELDISIKLHAPDTIVLFDHQDCGAYAADNTIPSNLAKDEDKNMHRIFSHKAHEYIKERWPNIEVTKLYMPFEGEIETID